MPLFKKDSGLKITLLGSEFSSVLQDSKDEIHDIPRITVLSKRKIHDCKLYLGYQFARNEGLYFLNYTMVCDQMRSNTLYKIVKVLEQNQITPDRQGFCCDLHKCLHVLSDKIDCNHLFTNAFFSDIDIYMKRDVEILLRREVITYSQNPQLQQNIQKLEIHDTNLNNMSLTDQISHSVTKNPKFMLSDKSVSLLQRSEVVIRTFVIALWQYLMFVGLVLLYILVSWIWFNLLIEFFSLTF